MIIDIASFYLGIVLSIFTRVLNGFDLGGGLGFGTFLLGCSIFVAFVSLLKFQYYNPSLQALKRYHAEHRSYKGKHVYGGKHARK